MATAVDSPSPVIRARGVRVDQRGSRSGVLRRRAETVRAVVGLDADLYAGELVWLVGAPGMGAPEAGRVLCGELAPSAGTVELDGRVLATMRPRRRARARREAVWLGPENVAGLDLRRTPVEIVAEAEAGSARTVTAEHHANAEHLLGQLGLGIERASVRTSTLSGADRRVVEVARTVALRPRAIGYLPEWLDGSAPDDDPVWTALTRLRTEASTALVVVSEALPRALGPGERALVLCGGRVVEALGPGDVAHPLHPYTRTLSTQPLASQVAAPLGDGRTGTGSEGCPFLVGCPRAKARCSSELPRLTRPLGATHDVACHFPEDPRRTRGSGDAADSAPGPGVGADFLQIDLGHSDEPTAREFAEG